MSARVFDRNRRRLLQACSALSLPVLRSAMAMPDTLRRPIHASGEQIPALGMGTWITFNVGENRSDRAQRVEVLRTFFGQGGALIDSSPMYGSAEEVIGYCLARLGHPPSLFSATKVWTPGQWLGIRQMERSQELWGGRRFDLMQVHNLLDWRTHLETLRQWREEGRIRYLGITTSHGRRHEEFARIMREQPLDFVQFTYNVVDREAEQHLLPLAAERAQSVIVNRPFRRGALFDAARGKPLPGWAAEIDCLNWAEFFLKFILSHPAVTCAIPATSRVEHMRENMGALRGRLPDARQRVRMAAYVRDVF